MNTPYVKRYENGKLMNPIVGKYSTGFSNRRQRRNERTDINNKPFHGNSKNFHLTVQGASDTGYYKYRRRRQIIHLKDGSCKTVEHYDLTY